MSETEKTTIPPYLKPFFDKVTKQRGRISTVHYESPIEIQKSAIKKFPELGDHRVVKKSKFQVRAGIDYENISVVKEKHESGEVKRKGLPESMEKIDTGVYHNKYTNQWYVGCEPSKNSHSIHEVVYEVDGEPINLDDSVVEGKTWRDIFYSKDVNKKESDWINLKVENITKFTLAD